MNGIGWALAAAVGFGVFQVLHRKAADHLDAIRGTFIVLVVSSLVLIAATLLTTNDISLLRTAPVSAIMAFAAAGFIHFFFGWTMVTVSQNQIGAARTGAIVGTMPVFGLVIDIVLYHEVFSWEPLLGIALIIGGVYIISVR